MSVTRVKNITDTLTVSGANITAAANITADTTIVTTTQVPFRIENTAANNLGSYIKVRDGNSTSGEHSWIGRSGDETYIWSSNNNVGLKTTNAGIVRQPNLPSFGVWKSGHVNISGSQTLEIGGWSTATYGHNIGGHFNTGTGRFTAPVDGRYVIIVSIMHGYTTGDYQVHLAINGGGNRFRTNDMHPNSASAWQNTNLTAVFNLSANDYVNTFVYNSSTMSYAVYGGSGFSNMHGYLLA